MKMSLFKKKYYTCEKNLQEKKNYFIGQKNRLFPPGESTFYYF